MTIDDAIKEFTDWAKDNRKEQNFWAAERDENDETNPLSYADCEGLARDAETRAEYHEQLAEWLIELKEARKLLTATKYKAEHEEWDMHGEHHIGDYALCPNCDKCFTNIYNGKAAPVVTFCPDCGQKIDWL